MNKVAREAQDRYPDPRMVSDDIEDMYTEDVVVEREQEAFMEGVEYAARFHADHLDALRADLDTLIDELYNDSYHPDSYS